jgi:hypothetical protein
MYKPLIKLACRQFIDANSTTPFEQKVFHATYTEFLIRRQRPFHTSH